MLSLDTPSRWCCSRPGDTLYTHLPLHFGLCLTPCKCRPCHRHYPSLPISSSAITWRVRPKLLPCCFGPSLTPFLPPVPPRTMFLCQVRFLLLFFSWRVIVSWSFLPLTRSYLPLLLAPSSWACKRGCSPIFRESWDSGLFFLVCWILFFRGICSPDQKNGYRRCCFYFLVDERFFFPSRYFCPHTEVFGTASIIVGIVFFAFLWCALMIVG